MARPDCDDGWIKKSVELEAALDFADFGKYARTILRYAFAQLFGRGDRPGHAVISCSEIAARIGRKKQFVYRGLDQLIASGVLVRAEGVRNGFRFVKDYERWVEATRDTNAHYHPTLRRLLTDAEIADCKAAPGYAWSFAGAGKPAKSVPPRGDKTSSRGGTGPLESVPPSGDKTSPHRGTGSVDPVPPSGDNPEMPSSRGGTSCPPIGGQAVPPSGDKTDSPYVPPIRNRVLDSEEFSLTPDGVKAGAPRKTSRKKTASKCREVPPRPPVEGDDASMKWVRDMILTGTRDEEHPDGDHDRGDEAVRAMVEWRARNYADADIKFAFQKAVRQGVVRKSGFFEFVKAVLVGETTRRAEIPAAPAGLPEPPPRLTKGQRDALELQRQREIARQNRLRKEAIHAQGE